jgi:predicted TIM-barrel fold metal-dependent hydrolase
VRRPPTHPIGAQALFGDGRASHIAAHALELAACRLRLIDLLGEDTIMWGSDFPHPDGVWPDSQAFIERELVDVPEATRSKLVCGNAVRLYGF